MRTLDYVQRSSTDRLITTPRYLIEVTLTGPLRLSTREGVLVGSDYYAPGEIQEGSVQIENESASFRIRNPGYQYTQGALKGAFHRNVVKIYSAYSIIDGSVPAYVEPGYWADDYLTGPIYASEILLFDGHISQVSDIDEWITINCRGTLPKTYPLGKIRPPVFNHLPAPGMVILWKGESYRIEG